MLRVIKLLKVNLLLIFVQIDMTVVYVIHWCLLIILIVNSVIPLCMGVDDLDVM